MAYTPGQIASLESGISRAVAQAVTGLPSKCGLHRVNVLLAIVFVVSVPGSVAAEAPSRSISLTPHIGVVAESDLVSGTVRFSDGGVDFISVEPDAAPLIGVELSVQLQPKLYGVVALSFAVGDARYIEDGELRPDVGIQTFRLQPGVMANIAKVGKTRFGVGGGLTIARISVDDMVWSDRRIEPRLLAIGLFGAGSIDIDLSPRIALHGHLALEIARPTYGNLEDELALADGEVSSNVEHDLRTGFVLAIGVAFAL